MSLPEMNMQDHLLLTEFRTKQNKHKEQRKIITKVTAETRRAFFSEGVLKIIFVSKECDAERRLPHQERKHYLLLRPMRKSNEWSWISSPLHLYILH